MSDFKISELILVNIYLVIEFYLFVSHCSMKDIESTMSCKFRNARNLHVYNTMRNKQVEFNRYIYTFFKIVPFWL